MLIKSSAPVLSVLTCAFAATLSLGQEPPLAPTPGSSEPAVATAQQEPDEATRAKLQARDQLMQNSQDFREQGQLPEAIEQAEKCLAIELELFGENSEGVDFLNTELALLMEQAERWDAALNKRKKLLQRQLTLHDASHWMVTDAKLAIKNIEHRQTLSPEQVAELLRANSMADMVLNEYLAGNYAAAVPSAVQSMQIIKSVLGEQHPDYATSLNILAELYAGMGDNMRAELLFAQSVQIARNVLGEQHPDYAWSLSYLAGLYEDMGDYTRAEPLFTQSMQIRRAALGEQHLDYATSLNNLAGLYQNMGDYARAEPLYTQSMQILKAELGEQHPDYASSLNNLAALYEGLGDYARAEPLYTQSLQIRQAVLGEQHPDYAISLNNLAGLYASLGNYARAELLYTQSMQIIKNVLGEHHPDYATSLDNMGLLYTTMGDYARAEPMYVQAIGTRQAVLGEQHPSYATSLNNLGLLYASMGDYARAEPLYTQSMQITKDALGERHPDYATSLNNLAGLYASMGDYARAEPLYVQAMGTRQAVLGDQHPSYATSLNNLAQLYASMGDYVRAEPLYTQSMQITKAVLGEQHPEYATCLNNVALLYANMADYERAESLYVQSMQIRKAVLGEQHPDYATSLHNLAWLYADMGEFSRAEPLCAQSMEIFKAVLGEQHPHYAVSLNNLALLFENMGDYARAEPLYVQSIQIRQAVLGEQHPDYALSLNNLALLYAKTERFALAFPLYEQALEISRRSLDETAYILSERQQLAMNQNLRYQLDNYLSACLASPSMPPQAVENVMLWKGSVLHRLRGLRIAAEDPSISDQFSKLQLAAAHLSKLAQVIPETDQATSWKEQVAQRTTEKEVLEAQLMRSSAAFRQAVQQVTFGQIQQSIPEDGALVDYLEFAGAEGQTLLVSIVKRDAEPLMIALGSASEVGQAIDVWRETFGMSPQAKAAGLNLRKQIWEPVLAHLGSANTILVSTDGVLGRLPLAALPGKQPGSYLIEDHRLALIPVPQLLPALVNEQGLKKLQRELLLIGDVNYDSAAEEASAPPPDTAARKRPWERSSVPEDLRGDAHWSALTETRAEVEFISGLYKRLYRPGPEAVLDLRQAAATEAAFRSYAPQSVFLHLATHGFFASSEKQSALSADLVAQRGKDRAGLLGQEASATGGYSPGQLSGIVFAGANRRPSSSDASGDQAPADDGIMTADEIAFLRLEGVRLVVLSACETGLGEVAGGEGLLGIQRGFQLAGAHSVVASLWKVNDAATRRLMQEFYTNYLDKETSMLDALRETQLWALNHPGDVPRGVRRDNAEGEATRLPPQYWAPFVLSGDWR